MDLGAIDLAYLLPFIGVGFAAQLVDGALGMAFGVISNTLLVGVLGVPPAQASQRVHLVECFTTATSGISHLLHGNIDKRLFFQLLIPGVLGGIGGAYVLTSLHAEVVKPFVLAYLAGIGLYLLWRGLFYPPKVREAGLVAPLGLVGGFLDAAGGGGWGPVGTSNLLIQGADPRKVVLPDADDQRRIHLAPWLCRRCRRHAGSADWRCCRSPAGGLGRQAFPAQDHADPGRDRADADQRIRRLPRLGLSRPTQARQAGLISQRRLKLPARPR